MRRIRGKHTYKLPPDIYLNLLALYAFIGKYHAGTDRGIERHRIDIFGDFFDGFVKQCFKRRIIDFAYKLFFCTHQPHTLQETLHTYNASWVPRDRLVERPQKHFIESQGLGTKFFYYRVGVD